MMSVMSLVVAVVTLIVMAVIAGRQNALNSMLSAQANQIAGSNLLNIATFTKLPWHGVQVGNDGSVVPWSSAKSCSNEFTWIQNQGRSDTSVTGVVTEDQEAQLGAAMLNPETKQIQVSAPFNIPAGQVRILLVDTPPSAGYERPSQGDSPVAAQCPLTPATFVQLDGTSVRRLQVNVPSDSSSGTTDPSDPDFSVWYQRFDDACPYGISTCLSGVS